MRNLLADLLRFKMALLSGHYDRYLLLNILASLPGHWSADGHLDGTALLNSLKSLVVKNLVRTLLPRHFVALLPRYIHTLLAGHVLALHAWYCSALLPRYIHTLLAGHVFADISWFVPALHPRHILAILLKHIIALHGRHIHTLLPAVDHGAHLLIHHGALPNGFRSALLVDNGLTLLLVGGVTLLHVLSGALALRVGAAHLFRYLNTLAVSFGVALLLVLGLTPSIVLCLALPVMDSLAHLVVLSYALLVVLSLALVIVNSLALPLNLGLSDRLLHVLALHLGRVVTLLLEDHAAFGQGHSVVFGLVHGLAQFLLGGGTLVQVLSVAFLNIPRGAFFVVLGVALLILLEVALFHVLCVALLFRHVFTLHLGHVDSLRHLDEDALPVLL